MDRQAHIIATLGVRRIRFELKRDQWTLGVLEALGLSPFAVYNRLGRGVWSHEILIAFLSLAYTPGRDLKVAEVEELVAAEPYGQLVPLLASSSRPTSSVSRWSEQPSRAALHDQADRSRRR